MAHILWIIKHFVEWNVLYFDKNVIKFAPNHPVHNESELFRLWLSINRWQYIIWAIGNSEHCLN